MATTDDPVTLLACELPAGLERRVLTLRPRETRLIGDTDWAASFVVLEHGQVELADRSGYSVDLEEGASFHAPPGATRVTVTGKGQAVLAVITRKVAY